MHRHQPVKSSQSTSLNMLHQRVQIGQPLFDLSVRVRGARLERLGLVLLFQILLQ